jgi:hypothetical protein
MQQQPTEQQESIQEREKKCMRRGLYSRYIGTTFSSAVLQIRKETPSVKVYGKHYWVGQERYTSQTTTAGIPSDEVTFYVNMSNRVIVGVE